MSDQRRKEVSQATWQVIIRDGLDRTSLRAIAQELGCTTGVVTHYFRNKEELILFALQQVTEELEQTMRQQATGKEGLEKIHGMLLAFLPLDDHRQNLVRVWVAFLGYAVGRDSLLAEHKHSAKRLHGIIKQELEELEAENMIKKNLDLESEVNSLLAFVNGMSLDCFIQANPLTPPLQEQYLNRYLKSIFLD
ncbi:regulatory protein TetR [Cyanobacterium stanieri PCC 7202]|uniref:Regulatory protein TetR n=1 Tax=Cyanobacterium stanieri (strain ATCC 29140 / PCC 7202) TaxID=292563 RepID=K9YN21_CYASC|nr:regulatory protein TetR [Cyanobacterium stanieri PCC 7202]